MNTPSLSTPRLRRWSRSLPLLPALLAIFATNAAAAGGVTALGTPASQYATSSTLAGFTVPAGTNRLLVVTASDPGSPNVPMGVMFGGTPMQLANSATDSANASDSIWVLSLGTSASPTVANIVVSASGAVEKFIAASVYEGVDQASPATAGPTTNIPLGTDVGSSLLVASAVGDLVYDVFDAFRSPAAATITVGPGQTVVHNQSGAITIFGFAHYETSTEPGAGTVTMSWTTGPTTGAEAILHATINIKAAPSAAPAPSITSTVTPIDTQSTSGLVITPNSGSVTHFKITAITNGTLFKNDGTTSIANNAFITLAEGAAGLKFTPTTGFTGSASFAVAGAFDNTGTGLGPTATADVVVASAVAAGDLVIREFRLRGPAGATDEYVEIANKTSGALTIGATDGSAGFGIAAQNAGACPTGSTQILASIPNGTVIPEGGFYLAAHGTGYSLNDYGGTGAGAPNATWTPDVCDGSGVGLFRSSTTLDSGTALDAVGFATLSTSPYLEGPGLPAAWGAVAAAGQYAFTRKAPYRTGGVIQDTGGNAADFYFVSTDAAIYSGVQSALGTPGPQNLASPVSSTLPVALADPGVMVNSAPNRLQSGNYYYFRRMLTNNTGAPITSLKFRIVDISTLFGDGYNPGVQADWRGIGTSDVVITLSDSSTPTAKGLTLEAPTVAFSAVGKGAGYNASFTVNLGGPLANGASVYVNIGMRNIKGGGFYFMLAPEILN